MKKNRKKLVIVTTVPMTIEIILAGQPAFLSSAYQISLVSSAGIKEVSHREGVKGYRVDMQRGITPFRDLVSLFFMIKLFFKIKPDLIHSYTPKAGLIVALAAFICRVPIRIHTFTGLIFPTSKGIKRLLLQFFDGFVIRLNTHIICEGRGVLEQLEKAGFENRKFEIIGNGNIAGVDLDYFNPLNFHSEQMLSVLKSSPPFDPDKKTFVYVGRLNRDKGIDELTAAFDKFSDIAQLLIVGELDSTLPLSQETIERLHQNSAVFSTGFLDDIRPALKLSDCLILSSYREGFPNVILQAGAMKLPCIVTDIPGSNEIITDGVNGFIVSARSIEDLEGAMSTFLEMDSESIENMANSARYNVEENFDRKWYQKQLVAFYERVLSNV